MPITGLHFTDIGPFKEATLEFDPQVNVLTGPNNTGKSTILWLLGELLVYPFTIPSKVFRSASPSWKLGYSTESGIKQIEGKLPAQVENMVALYSDVVGYTCLVPALRQATDFRSTGPTSFSQDNEMRRLRTANSITRSRPALLNDMGSEELSTSRFLRTRASDPEELRRRAMLTQTDASWVSDAEIIQKIINLDYASYRNKQPAKIDIVRKVASLATEITSGYPLTFAGVEEDEQGLFPLFNTPDGPLPFNVLSQGTQSLLHSLARLLFGYAEYYDFPTDLEDKKGILIIDEVDAHLHPTWQRGIIPAITSNFPNLQIFCSTHSPLMLAGLKSGQVHLLEQKGESNETRVSRNDSDIIGWTADEIFRGLLQVPNPTDKATSKNVERLQELRYKEMLTPFEEEELARLREVINKDLLTGQFSSQIEEFSELLEQAGFLSGKKGESPNVSNRDDRK